MGKNRIFAAFLKIKLKMEKKNNEAVSDFYTDPKSNLELLKAFRKFFQNETTSGVLLLVAAVISIVIATFWGEEYNHILETPLAIGLGEHALSMSVHHWINDGLMAIFFFVIGLEIKREVLVGHLSSFRQAILPVMGAIGGMLAPAAIYALCNMNNPEAIHGWGIPMATDIAFAIGILALLGSKVPVALKVFLTALAVADDLGAILVLAIFYPTHAIHLELLLVVAGIMALLALYNHFVYGKMKIRSAIPYIIAGIFMWFYTFESGIHATIAGVLLAMMIPARSKVDDRRFIKHIKSLTTRFEEVSDDSGEILSNPAEQAVIHRMNEEINEFDPLLHRLEDSLSPFSSYIIMPVFALTNANVALNFSAFSGGIPTVFLGIFFGLLIGKPLGIFLMSFLSIKTGLSAKPEGCSYAQFLAVAILGGIGFTMSIFVNSLAFSGHPEYTEIGKMSILIASVVVAILGYVACNLVGKKK